MTVPASRLWALLLAGWLLGLAHLAVLPPYEGFDEIAHHASIRQIAATGTMPGFGRAMLPVEIETYIREGPSPYPELSAAIGGRGHDYASFFRDDAARAATAALLHAPAPVFVPGRSPNWQSQHPPLYYLALAPIERLLWKGPLADRLAALRLASWTLAVIGFGIGAFTLARFGRAAGLQAAGMAAMLMAAWPFVMPMALPEFARLGNDSLCLLITAGMVAVLLRRLDRRPFPLFGPLLGLLAAAGLLTKAFFLPITAGTIAFLLWLAWRWRDGRLLRDAAVALALAAAAGGWWYLGNLLHRGDLVGGLEFVDLESRGGLGGTIAAGFEAMQFLRGLAAIAASFVWAGTQTLARLPEALLALPVAAVALPLAAGLYAAWRQPEAPVLRLPAFLILPFAAGLAYHVLIRLALSGKGIGTPGWYMHLLAPAWAIVAASGIAALRQHRFWWPACIVLAIAGAAHIAASLVLQMALFAGCAVKDAQKHYASAGDPACPGAIPARLAELGQPTLAAMALAGTAVILLSLALLRRRD